MTKVTPVILSGGSGTRLWPMSVPARPKQFLPLTCNRTMFELTAMRVQDASRFSPPLVVANKRHAAMIVEQLDEIGSAAGTIILEPCARNTAPAIALAALEAGEGSILLVMPSDHVITDEAAFQDAIAKALPLVEGGWLATFGISPTGPDTGYGYIKIGVAIGDGVHEVAQFREKPDLANATIMLASGDHVWNGGIFLFRSTDYLAALETHAPEILEAARESLARGARDGAFLHPDEDAFGRAPSESIDYAVMEKSDRVAVVPVSMGWSDVGSWDALFDLGAKDEALNSIIGDVRLASGSGNLIRTDGIRISVSGVEDLIIIASGNEVMILPRGQSQDVKKFSN